MSIFNPKNWPRFIQIIVILAVLAGGALAVKKIFFTAKSSATYKTATVTKGILVTSISTTGTITSSNKTSITTGATGTIKTVYIKNGDTVTKGQKIAEITLDDDGTTNKVTAWANYLTMLQNEKSAIADQSSADIQMWKDRQAVLDAQEEYNNMKAGSWNHKTNKEYTYNEQAVVTKTLTEAQQTFTADETKFNNYAAFVTKAKQQTAAALASYNKVSSTIYAPTAGIISNLSIAAGVIISNSSTSITVSTGTDSNTNSSTVSSHSIGSVTNPDGQYQATLNLTESDIPKIKSGQKVTLTMDAFEGITFTGSVLAVNVSGTTSSGVTTYPVVVLLDDTDKEIYTGMAVTSTVIISSKSDILLIPSTAIDTDTDGTSTVRVLKDNKVSTVTIKTGDSNDSQTEVSSGLSEGSVVVASSVSNDTKSNNNSSSLFNSTSTGGMGGGMGGGPPGM